MGSVRQGLVIILAALLAVPSWASTPVVGTVQDSNSAAVRGTPLVPGTTVFSEDKIEVGADGRALIVFPGGAQLQLQASSEARILRPDKDGRVQVEINRGVARFRSTGQAQLDTVLADATITPANGSAAGYIAFLSPTSAAIGAEKGALVITTAHDGASATIPEGSTMSVRIVSDDTGSGVQPAVATSKGKVILLGLLIMSAVIGAAVAANEIATPPKTPTSPFRP
jgi:hypothetical protein